MKKAYLFLATGFEEIEALTPVDVLRRAGFDLKTVSISQEKTVTGAHNISVIADLTIDNISANEADVLILPGGMPGTTNLMACDTLHAIIAEFARSKKAIAAICAAPRILGQMGLLNNHSVCCYPGTESFLKGAIIENKAVVSSGQFITANGAGAAMEFSLQIVSHFEGKETAHTLAKKMMVI